MCQVKARLFDPRANIESLHEVPVSRAQAMQRAGRAGRQYPGKAYRLYTEESFEELEKSAVPEIKRCRLSSLVLQMRVMGIHNLMEFEFLEPPPKQLLLNALEQLIHLGAIGKDKSVTDLGRKMAMLPLEPTYAKLILSAPPFHCTEEIVTVVAMLSVESLLITPAAKKEEASRARSYLVSSDGDHITYLQIWNAWSKAKNKKEWCMRHFINARNMKKVSDIREQLRGYCDQGKLEMHSCDQELTAVAKCLVTAFYSNVATLAPNKKCYKVEATSQEVYIHPSSTLFNRKPSCIIYDELVLTGKLYMRNCTVIDATWVPELAPSMFRTRQ